MICTNCYYHGEHKTKTRGSFAMELVLWIFFFWLWFIPGLVYSIWRITGKHKVCGYCRLENTLIPIDSPRGKELLDKLS